MGKRNHTYCTPRRIYTHSHVYVTVLDTHMINGSSYEKVLKALPYRITKFHTHHYKLIQTKKKNQPHMTQTYNIYAYIKKYM